MCYLHFSTDQQHLLWPKWETVLAAVPKEICQVVPSFFLLSSCGSNNTTTAATYI